MGRMDAIEAALAGREPDWDAPAPPEIARLVGCPQTQRHHLEGDVATHTRMTVSLAAELGEDLDDDAAALLRVGALLHDVGKPETTVDEGDGRFPARGHESVGGDISALLGQTHPALLAMPIAFRAGVSALVRHHMWTYHADDLTPGEALRASHEADPRLLHALWLADTRGRECSDPQALAEQVAYAAEVLREHDAHRPASYGPLDHVASRADLDPYVVQSVFRDIVTGRLAGRWATEAAVVAAEKQRRPGSITYTVGLPGVGKSTWTRARAEQHDATLLTVTGSRRRDRRLTAIRNDQAVPGLLAEGRDVVVDATHLSRRSRDRLVGYAGRYRVPVHAVVFDAPVATSVRRQATRPDADAVPAARIRSMARQLRHPTPDEYTTLTLIDVSSTAPVGGGVR